MERLGRLAGNGKAGLCGAVSAQTFLATLDLLQRSTAFSSKASCREAIDWVPTRRERKKVAQRRLEESIT
jgi:hypothetical protein